nr:reverse transcriptase domain-containing protein [Tanacetum cinerariifolium]
MVDSQPMKEEVHGIDMRDEGAEIQKGPTKPTPQTQTTLFPSLAFVRENIDVLRTMIKESMTKGFSDRLSLKSIGTSDTRGETHSASKGQKGLSNGKEPSCLRRSKRVENKAKLRKEPKGRNPNSEKEDQNTKKQAQTQSKMKGDKGNTRLVLSKGQKRARNRNGPREEILAMKGISFLEPPPLIGIQKRQYLNKFCDYHRDRGHNTNDCYQLKKQIEKDIASGKLAHLVRDICRSNKKSGNKIKNDVKVIHMIAGGRNRKRPYKEERYGLTEELTFMTIPQDSLTDEPIVLKGMIEEPNEKSWSGSLHHSLYDQVPNGPGSYHNGNKQGNHVGVQAVGKNAGFVGRNTMASTHGTN